MAKILVIGFETEWMKHLDEVFIVPNLREVEFKIDKGKLTIYKNHKVFEPDVVLYRKIPDTDLDKRFFTALKDFNGLVINKPEASIRANQTYHSLQLLKKEGIRVPESICFCGHKLIDVNKLKYPILIKIEGVHAGNGKALIQNKEELKEALNLLISESKNNILQEYLDVIRDYRVLVLKDNVIDSVIRKSENWKKNTSSEPEPVHFKIPELERLSIKAARCLGLDLAGVDVLETPDGYFVIEVNPEPGIEYFGDKAYKAVVDYIVENEKRQKIHQEAC